MVLLSRAGWLTSQTADTGQDIAYTHFNNGYVQSVHDKALGMYTYYEYDYNGNKTFEGYISLKNAASIASGASKNLTVLKCQFSNDFT